MIKIYKTDIDTDTLSEIHEFEKGSYTIHPIIMNGDAIGLVLIFCLDKTVSETEVKISQIISQILGKHIEE